MEPNIDGYRVYIGTASSSYAQVIDVGMQTRFQLGSLGTLIPGVTHFLAVTAYDDAGLESPFSQEVIFTPVVNGTTAALLPLKLTALNGIRTLTFSGRAGQHARVVASTNLSSWETVHQTTLLSSLPVLFTDLSAVGKPTRFYRIVATPP